MNKKSPGQAQLKTKLINVAKGKKFDVERYLDHVKTVFTIKMNTLLMPKQFLC